MFEKIGILDWETTGLNEDVHSLATVAYTITDRLYNVLISKSFKVPIQGAIDPEAMKVNGLDLTNWQHNAVVSDIVDEFIEDLWEGKAILIWHNITFDFNFMKKRDWNQVMVKLVSRFERNILDSRSLLVYLRFHWMLEGSTSLHKFLWLPPWQHDCQEDTYLVIEAMKKIDRLYGFDKIL